MKTKIFIFILHLVNCMNEYINEKVEIKKLLKQA